MELTRDPIRMTLAGLGSVILMIIMGYGITLDVEHLNYAVLDRDQTTISRDYLINITGSSRYFTERPPVADYEELDRRMRSGELSMVIEIPPGFGRDVDAADARRRPRSTGQTSRCRSASGSTAPCRSAPRRSGATCRACTSSGCQDVARHQLGVPATRPGSAPTGPRHDRAALPLQPRRQEPGGDGAGSDPAAACS